jgi:hypothetical protein
VVHLCGKGTIFQDEHLWVLIICALVVIWSFAQERKLYRKCTVNIAFFSLSFTIHFFTIVPLGNLFFFRFIFLCIWLYFSSLLFLAQSCELAAVRKCIQIDPSIWESELDLLRLKRHQISDIQRTKVTIVSMFYQCINMIVRFRTGGRENNTMPVL